MKNLTLFTTIFIMLGSCGSNKLKEFYFKPDDFKEKKYYKYVNQDNKSEFFFWELIGKGDTLITNAYGHGHYLISESAEIVDEQSAKVIQMMRYEGASPVEVKSLEGGFIEFDHNGPYPLNTAYVGQDGLVKTHQKRNFIEFTTINYQGKEVKAMVLEKEEEYHIEKNDEKFIIKQTDYYTKEHGLVRYKREVPGKTYHYELEEILSEEEWQKELEIDKAACDICLLRDSIIQLDLKMNEIAECVNQKSVEEFNQQYKRSHQALKNLKKKHYMDEKYAQKRCMKTYDFIGVYDNQKRNELLKKYYGFAYYIDPFKTVNIKCIDINRFGNAVGNGKYKVAWKGKYETMTQNELKS